MLLPTRKLLILLLLPAAVLLACPWRNTAAVVLGYDVAMLLVAALCVWLSPRPGQIGIERKLPEHLSLGTTNQVGWDIRNMASTPLKFELTEDVPESFERAEPGCAASSCPTLPQSCVTALSRRAAVFTRSATYSSVGRRIWDW